jgi:hypothetical protein
MVVATLILVFSAALFIFYIQVTCQKILRQKFDREYSRSIVNANRLEFPAVQRALGEFDGPLDYARLRMTLRCDFLALTYLLKNAGNLNQRYSRDEMFLIIYSRALFLSFYIRHLLRIKEKPAVLKLTEILEYFANIVGQRVNALRFGNLTPSDYLLNL